jgi:hypothetical protein
VDADGRVGSDTQTAYVLALHMNLLPSDVRARAATHLVEAIRLRQGESHLVGEYAFPTPIEDVL